MEKIKVNMSPNPLDVQTIHASQNDGEARQWEFELHNNGELIDTSEVTEQMFFKAYKGGTEQLLPENGSTPTTSPFKGDIRYPQGLLSDQEFLYRESPTEEDGLAKITDIKGNTLVWNQLVQNGNFADTSNWSSSSNVSITASNNILRVTNAVGRNGDYYSAQNIPMKVGHKYYFHAEAKKTDVSTAQTLLLVFFGEGSNTFAIDALKEKTDWVSRSTIFTCASNTYNSVRLRTQVANATNEFRNVVLIDLTQMGLDISSPSDFTSLFPLPYYAYNQGSLLSFNGNGIKTVGKNIFDGVLQNGTIDQHGQEQSQANRYRTDFLRVFPNTRYVISVDGVIKNVNIYYYDINKNFISSIGGSLVTTPSNCAYMRFYYDQSIVNVNLQLEMLKSGDSPTPYEPYTSSTLSLPVSTYFPTGMKSAGSVYDELTPNKAITRVGAVDSGTLTWIYDASTPRFYTQDISSIIKKPLSNNDVANATSVYKTVSLNGLYDQSNDKCIAISAGGVVSVKDTSYSDLNAFKTAMSGVYLYYELATPTETSFTTASLVTENGEIPLFNEDGVLIGKCTEQLSENPGFIDAKIKLSDSDGTCYSNKLQLHVERSPQ